MCYGAAPCLLNLWIRREIIVSFKTLVAVGVLAASVVAGCGSGGGSKLSLVAYSTPQEAYNALIPAFNKTTEGKGVTFSQSYGASGDQSRAVASGLPADVVEFAIQSDMTKLADAGKVPADWDKNQHKGIVTNSVVTFVVRKGNPKNIKTWDDLTKPGIQVITPNPFTSGGARWNVMAGYGAASNVGKDDAAGVTYLNSLFKNVPVQDDSARKSLETFANGKGDVMLAYENEAIFAKQHGQALDYVIPDKTILIENPVAVTSTSKNPVQAKAFLDFLHSTTAQKIYADAGYRPIVMDAAKSGQSGQFSQPAGLFTITDLGGWTSVSKKFFDATTGVMADVERKLGVATQK
jgi:sulfate/thiosulfate-binding protein